MVHYFSNPNLTYVHFLDSYFFLTHSHSETINTTLICAHMRLSFRVCCRVCAFLKAIGLLTHSRSEQVHLPERCTPNGRWVHEERRGHVHKLQGRVDPQVGQKRVQWFVRKNASVNALIRIN